MDKISVFFNNNRNIIIISIISLIVLGGIIGIIVYYNKNSNTPKPSNNCPNNCSGNGTCSDITNTCSCNPGYSGADCSSKIITCPNNCTDSEHGICNTDGTCSCKLGFTGTDCSSKICLNNCSENGTCNLDGTCSCKSGFTGPDCSSKTCPSCGKNQTCNSKNGTCQCDTGYTLDTNTGNCIKICPKPCQHGGVCDEDTGLCKCANEWKGDDCSQTTCPTPLCGTGETAICCKNNESCVNGVCCDTNKICKNSTGVDVCCDSGCCSDIRGNKLCCAPGQSCTEGGCCDNNKVWTDKSGTKYCCGKAVCNGQCCNDEIEICDPIKGCRTACGDENCDPETEVCEKITNKDGKVLQSCAKKDNCQWDSDLIYNPASITTAPNTPLYLDNDGTISWCQGGKEIAGNMARQLETRVNDPTKCSLGNCYQRLSQKDMNFVSWDQKSGLCEGVITAKDAPRCDGKCPTGIQDQSCCKNLDGSSNGLICPEDKPICNYNNCFSGYNVVPNPNNNMGNICELTSDPSPQHKTLDDCANDPNLCVNSSGHKYHYDKINNECTLNIIGELCNTHGDCLGNGSGIKQWQDGTPISFDNNGFISNIDGDKSPNNMFNDPRFGKAACFKQNDNTKKCTDTTNIIQLWKEKSTDGAPDCSQFWPGILSGTGTEIDQIVLPGVKTMEGKEWVYSPQGNFYTPNMNYWLCGPRQLSQEDIKLWTS